MLTNEALESLRQWLLNNDKYSHLLANRRSPTSNNTEPRLIDEYVLDAFTSSSTQYTIDRSITFRLLFEELQELFLQAVSLAANPSEIDADLQVRFFFLRHLLDQNTKENMSL